MTAQLKLIYPDSPGFKKRGTSENAARKVAGKADHRRRVVLECLRQIGPMTCIEIAHALQWDKTSVRPRITELYLKGLIKDTGIRRYENSKSGETVWQAI